jgi:hypothetical protein
MKYIRNFIHKKNVYIKYMYEIYKENIKYKIKLT